MSTSSLRSATVPASSVAAQPRHFKALAGRAPVAICAPACLRLRSRHASCRACADACPVQALYAAEQTLALVADCTGCGRCQAACPTGALSVEGFGALQRREFEPSETVTLECWQAAPTLPSDGAIRVPCLGGVSTGALLTLCAAADPAPVVLADRGWCANCASGAALHPARHSVESAASLMRQAGVPESRLPRLEPRPSRAQRAPRAHTDVTLARGKSRRGFLRALARPIEPAAPPASDTKRPLPSVERQQTLEALRLFVARYRGRMPQALFHRLEVRASCCGHQVCAAACPTGALVRYRDAGARLSGVAYDNSTCIGCGHCATACPEQAMAVHLGVGTVDQGLRRLNAFARRDCSDCGASFVPADGEDPTRCGSCRKSAHLARSAFQTLMGTRL